MTEIKKSKDFNTNFADVFITTAMNIGDNSYCQITFCRHIVDNSSIPDEANPNAMASMYLEATNTITLPMSMAKNMAQAILNAPITDPGIITPFESKVETKD
ncbi:hypothetical protein ACWOOC_01080 [Citrobacter sp. ESY80]|uniref:hypothetical protein n=1 Tax=Citrobacter freundii complex TaxID=1344959 RepID=UPI0013D0249A|nr:hypothetical protein [Citrobacter freundii]NGF62138.1 hypothetical protein [Citrobacter freundii]QPO97068.1 hypothetical protein GVI61_11155 [Citrobacter freundii]HBV8336885.1 hypothetical protein [Citrobacter freundii]HCQ7322647.1 hypothetical protein [Citrobacter freundii]